MPNFLRGVLGWEAIMKVRGALFSKALVFFSLASYVLSYMSKWPVNLIFQWVVLIGSIVFIAGSLVSYFSATPEFSSGRPIPVAVKEMKQKTDSRFASNRIRMLERLISRISKNPPPDLPQAELVNAKSAIEEWAAIDPYNSDLDAIGSLYYADLKLRQFDNFRARMWSSVLLIGGSILMFFPVLSNLVLLVIQ